MRFFLSLLFSLLLFLPPRGADAQSVDVVQLANLGGVAITKNIPACVDVSVTKEKDTQAGYERIAPKVTIQNNCQADFTITGFKNASSVLGRYWPSNIPGARLSLQNGEEKLVFMYNPAGEGCGHDLSPKRICGSFNIPTGYSWSVFLYNVGFEIQSTDHDFVSFSSYQESWYGPNIADENKEKLIKEAKTKTDPDSRARTLARLSHIYLIEENWEEAYFWASVAISGKIKQALFERDVSALHLSEEQKAAIDKRVTDYIAVQLWDRIVGQ
ncbi:MAG TPA: hypothetical protein PLX33_09020 [Alphaproteobacteria bacterium]|nr:hypothetical protein [Alphaproteobacteria bacterium]